MSGFVSTEGNCGPPIRLSREPIDKPIIVRGNLTVLKSQILRFDDERQLLDFTTRHSGYRFTYWDIPLGGQHGGLFRVHVVPRDVVTWERLDPE